MNLVKSGTILGALLFCTVFAMNANSATTENRSGTCCTQSAGEPSPAPRSDEPETRNSCETQEAGSAECPSQTSSSVSTQSVDFVSGLSTKISIQRSGFGRYSRPGSRQKAATSGRSLGSGASADTDSDITLSGRLSPFVVVDHSENERRATNAGLAYKQDLDAVILGTDFRVSNDLIMGATLNYLKSDTDFANNRGHSESDNYVAGLHASHYIGNLYLDALLTYGKLDIDISRIDALGNRYDSETEGAFHSAELATGYNATHRGWGFTPSVRLLHLRGSLDGYGEVDINSGGQANNFQRQYFESLNARAALQVDYAMLRNWGVLVPSLYFAYHHEYIGAETTRSQTTFGTLTQTTDDPARNYRMGRLNLAAQFKRGLSGFLSYERLIDHEYFDRDTVTLGVRYEM
ncbi:autotransporter outer membrane beta-barrel domain-containing protein [Litorivivens sp.]|uniref:autotransporter outer membrane beta-barrel domain-containing protein n=1 Tax=Litorivivens sp. TaxID=2020868 RepID=UPI003567D376